MRTTISTVLVTLATVATVSTFVLTIATFASVGCGASGFGKEVRPDIEKQMASAKPMITACYQTALTRNRKLAGQMMIRIKTDAKTGRFHRARIAQTELPDKQLEQCVIETIAGLSLEKPTKTSVEADYPINFSPAN